MNIPIWLPWLIAIIFILITFALMIWVIDEEDKHIQELEELRKKMKGKK